MAPHALRRLAAVLGVFALAAGCATPVGVARTDPQAMYRSLTGSVVSTGTPSAPTEQALRRLGLDKRFEAEPETVLAELRGTGSDLGSDRLFALAELSFLHAEDTRKREYYLTAAVYAYAFLLERTSEVGIALDPRVRLAADLYNLGLSMGLQSPEANAVDLADRTLPLAFGELQLSGDPATFQWGGYRMSRFIAVMEFDVRGLRNRYRQPGLGAPLAAEVTPIDAGPAAAVASKRIPPGIKVPVTAFVRMEEVFGGIASGRVRGHLELHPADEATTVEVEGRTVPLQLEPTATLAYMLEGASIWDMELGNFLRPERAVFGDGLIQLHPYRPGRVPVVLVHGTASSPARWAEMINEIQNDRVLHDRVQLWLFAYNTSNPILYSAKLLRDALTAAVADLDPDGRDAALRQIVVIGHSQGGLLTRLMVTSSGSRFWDGVSKVPLADLTMSPEARALLQGALFFEPVPFVKRVVFVATPHRGSFRVTDFVRSLVRRLVTLPIRIVTTIAEAARQNPDSFAQSDISSAVDNMRPASPFIRTLSSQPIADGVTVHSIIAVLGTGPLTGATDGVVAYRSAHLDGVASEKIVSSGHSTQDYPETILEVRRILREAVGVP